MEITTIAMMAMILTMNKCVAVHNTNKADTENAIKLKNNNNSNKNARTFQASPTILWRAPQMSKKPCTNQLNSMLTACFKCLCAVYHIDMLCVCVYMYIFVALLIGILVLSLFPCSFVWVAHTKWSAFRSHSFHSLVSSLTRSLSCTLAPLPVSFN